MIKRYSLFLITLLFSHYLIAQIPTISSFFPTSGPIGTTVIITGTNFSATSVNDIVYFGATKASLINATTTSLIVTVPIGVTYQPISVTTNNLTAYSTNNFVVTFPCDTTGFTSESFASPAGFISGEFPFSIVTGDLDGDGKADIIAANYSDDSIIVFRNISVAGTISLASKVTFAVTNNPESVFLGDMDGDGKLDIVVVSDASKTVSVFRNTSTPGTISFDTRIDYNAGTYPVAVSVSDIDGDGKPDLIETNNQDNTVSVYRNTSTVGNISFATNVNFTTGSSPSDISVADFDGDGKPDLAIANEFSGTVSVLRNTSTAGTISFALKQDYITGAEAYAVAAGDIDGDGKSDLAVGNLTANTVSILRNTSTPGVISFAAKVDDSVATSPIDIALGDLDGDGKIDLSVASSDITLPVLKNLSTPGNISFAKKVSYNIGGSSSAIFFDDIDGDGKPDILLASFEKIYILRNKASCNDIIVPVTLTSFIATPVNNKIQLNWNTQEEINIQKYVIERAVTGSSEFIAIGTIESKSNQNDNNYSFTDTSAEPGVLYAYRLMIYENTSSSEFSDIKTAKISIGEFIASVYPNPSDGHLNLFINHVPGSANIEVFNNIGQPVFYEKITVLGSKLLLLDLSKQPKGTYWISIQTNENSTVKKLIIQ